MLQSGKQEEGVVPEGENWGKDADDLHGVLNIIENGSESRKRIITEYGNYMGFFDNVYEAVTSGKALAVDAETALKTIHIILKAMQSSKKKQVLTL